MFRVGDVVVHWSYGPGEVVQLDEKTVAERTERYYVVKVGEMTIWVPRDGEGASSLRPLTPRERFEALFDLLSSPGELLTTDRLGRKTELQQRMRDGSLESICLVIRDLYTQGQTARLNEADNITLNRARKFLLEEWRLVMGVSASQAEAHLKELLETGLAKYRQQTA
jgi:RNA polymerase-interacting CarD/CdnL/TRCF family regulator